MNERSWKEMQQDAGMDQPIHYGKMATNPVLTDESISHLAEAKYHLSRMSYGEFMEVIMGAINTSTHKSSQMLQRTVANRLWQWVKK